MNAIQTLVISAALLASAGVFAQQAQQGGDHASHHAQPANPAAADRPLSEGEVRRIDHAQGKVTLRHGPLENLGMPAMTMVFTATDKNLLDGLKVGDKVRFTADRKDGGYLVKAIQPAN
jgi:Cu(I)/Ag(I) efflux system periplasmic protein CusF